MWLPWAHLISGILPPTRCFGLRRLVFVLAGLKIAKTARIRGGAKFHYSNVSIGDHAWVGGECDFYSSSYSWIHIGARVDIAPGCLVNTGTHEPGTPERRAGKNTAQTITIGDGAWLGMGCMLLYGTEIGKGCIVTPGAVVRGKFPDNCLIGGMPAKVIKELPVGSEEAARSAGMPR